MALPHDLTPDGTDHAIIAADPTPVPLVFRPRGRSRSAIRPPTRLAVRWGRPGPRPADGHGLDPGRRPVRQVPPVLHHRRGRRGPGGPSRRPPGPGRGRAPRGRRPPTRVRPGRHPDPTGRAVCPGRRGPPQPDPGAGRRAVRVRARLGRSRPAHRPPGLGHHRLAPARPTVRPGQGSGRHPGRAPAGVPDQAGHGRRVDDLGQGRAGRARQAPVGGGRRGVRHGRRARADAGRGRDGRQPTPQGRGPVACPEAPPAG